MKQSSTRCEYKSNKATWQKKVFKLEKNKSRTCGECKKQRKGVKSSRREAVLCLALAVACIERTKCFIVFQSVNSRMYTFASVCVRLSPMKPGIFDVKSKRISKYDFLRYLIETPALKFLIWILWMSLSISPDIHNQGNFAYTEGCRYGMCEYFDTARAINIYQRTEKHTVFVYIILR